MAHRHDHTEQEDTGHEGAHDHGGGHDLGHDHAFPGRGMRGPRGRWGGGRGGWGGPRRMPRGAVRSAILVALRDEPANGYEVMRRLEEMSGGLWRPSPGSVYPHLQMLEDEGLVRATDADGSRVYTLTDTGRSKAEGAPVPWPQAGEGGDEFRSLRVASAQLMSAAKQLSMAGSASQLERGVTVVQRARKELYQILAED